MASGLLALLDDIAVLVKMSAVSIDDVSAQVSKTAGKVSGVVIDDAAVTPKYVVGLNPKRELYIIYRIARASMKNKVLFLAPAALLLGYGAPWLMTPLLMIGGAYLCMEGFEKAHAMLYASSNAQSHKEVAAMPVITPEALERERIAGAVRTDLILSAEIMAITYANVKHMDMVSQGVVLLSIAVLITVAVYGFVALLVKIDDIGLYLARSARISSVRALGRALVKAMPLVLSMLSGVGAAAMLWVGADIIAHGFPPVYQALNQLPLWLVKIAVLIVGGLAVGGVLSRLLGAFGVRLH